MQISRNRIAELLYVEEYPPCNVFCKVSKKADYSAFSSLIFRQLPRPYPLYIRYQRLPAHYLSRRFIHHIHHRSQRTDDSRVIVLTVVAQLPLLYQLHKHAGNCFRVTVILHPCRCMIFLCLPDLLNQTFFYRHRPTALQREHTREHWLFSVHRVILQVP